MKGRVWKFGDNIDTDLLAPGIYMKGPVEELARHCLEAVDPNFAEAVRPGDFVVAGRNFGSGSSREQAAQALKLLGVGAVLAESFGGIFYRNAFNLGLPALVSDGLAGILPGEELRIDLAAGHIRRGETGTLLRCDPVPDHLLAIVRDGGLVPHLEKQFKGGQA